MNHLTDKVPVVSGFHKHPQNILHRLVGLHAVKSTPHNFHSFLLLPVQKQILAPGSGLHNINCRENSPLGKLAVKDKLHVSGSLKLLVYHIIHTAAGIYQRSSQNCQAAAFPHIPGSSEKPLRHMQRGRIKTAGQSTPAGRNYQVIGSCQTGNAVQKNHHILSVLHQTLRPLNHHFRYTLVMIRKLVKSRINHFHIMPFNGLLNIGNLLGTFVNQENNQMHLRIISLNGSCHFF